MSSDNSTTEPPQAGHIRPFRMNDLEQAAALYEQVMRSGKRMAPPGLIDDFQHMFLTGDYVDPQFPSLVYENSQGRIVGFLGVYSRQMLWDGRPINMACSGQLVSEEKSRALGVGIFLMQKFLDGGQQLSITDGATQNVGKLWEHLGGQTSHLRCVHWTKILSHWRYGGSVAAQHAAFRPLATGIRPFAWLLDQPARGLRQVATKGRPVSNTRELTADLMCRYWPTFTSKKRLKMLYDEPYLNWLFGRLQIQQSRGALIKRAVTDSSDRVLGWFIYFLGKDQIAMVIQVAAASNRIEQVLKILVSDADRRGAVAAHGRLEPDLCEAIAGLRCRLQYEPPLTLVHSRNPEMLAVLDSRHSALSRLDCDWWPGFHRENYNGVV